MGNLGSREENKSQRKAEIIDAARGLIRRKGQQGGPAFSMRSLAEQAGVSIATPYNLFGSKQAILVSLLDDDFAEFQTGLALIESGGLEAVFEALALMYRQFSGDPDFYRNVFAAISTEAGPELRFVLSGPRYAFWKRLLRDATQAGQLDAEVDPDAFAITLSQIMQANVREWATGYLELEEMDARIRYGVALALSAIATASGAAQLKKRLKTAEKDLQTIWRAVLRQRLHDGKLSEASRMVLADQLKHIGSPILEQPEEETTT